MKMHLVTLFSVGLISCGQSPTSPLKNDPIPSPPLSPKGVGVLVKAKGSCPAAAFREQMVAVAADCLDGPPESLSFRIPPEKPIAIRKVVITWPGKNLAFLELAEAAPSTARFATTASGARPLVAMWWSSKEKKWHQESCRLAKYLPSQAAFLTSCYQSLYGAPLFQNGQIVAFHMGLSSDSQRPVGLHLGQLAESEANIQNLLAPKNETSGQ